MSRDTKNQIIEVSRRMFRERGYQAVGMRDIAKECGISVGNLNYHYPKKEDLLMVHHNQVLASFIEHTRAEISHREPLVEYFLTEYLFFHFLAFDAPTRMIFKEVINVPALRQEYFRKHHALFTDTVTLKPAVPAERTYLSTVAMCALEFQLLDDGQELGEDAFPPVMEQVFRTRLLFLGYPERKGRQAVGQAVAAGRELIEKIDLSWI